MDKQQMQDIMAEVLRDADLRSQDIPAIDLYLDQILSLVSDNRAQASAYHQDKQLTKTMVNNYSKDGLIADEIAIGVVNTKTTAVRVIPAYGKKVGDSVNFGGLLGYSPIMDLSPYSPAKFIARGGRIPAPIHSLKN